MCEILNIIERKYVLRNDMADKCAEGKFQFYALSFSLSLL